MSSPKCRMFASELDRPQGPPNVRDSSWFPANLLLLRHRGLSHPDLQDYSPWSPGEGGRVHQKGASVGAALSGLCCFPSDLGRNLRATALGQQGQYLPSFPSSFPTSPPFLLTSLLPPLYPLQPLSPAFLSLIPPPPLLRLMLPRHTWAAVPVRGCSGLGKKTVAETRKDITEDHLSRNSDGAREWVGPKYPLDLVLFAWASP